MRVKDKTVLITGAARGIGQATALEFAKAGAEVIGIDLSLADMRQTAEAVEKLDRNFKGFACGRAGSVAHQCYQTIKV